MNDYNVNKSKKKKKKTEAINVPRLSVFYFIHVYTDQREPFVAT